MASKQQGGGKGNPHRTGKGGKKVITPLGESAPWE